MEKAEGVAGRIGVDTPTTRSTLSSAWSVRTVKDHALHGADHGFSSRSRLLRGHLVGGGEHVAADGLQLDLGEREPGRYSLGHAPFPDRGGVQAAARG